MCRPTGCSFPRPVPCHTKDGAPWEDTSSDSEPESDTSSSESEPDQARLSPTAPRRWSAAPKALPSVGPVAALRRSAAPAGGECHAASLAVPPREAAPKSQAALACYLRKENSRLRQSLVRAQRRAEEAAALQPAPQGKSPDLAHLLALVRELDYGDSCGFENEQRGFVSISTPRGGLRPRASTGKAEVSSLREALRESEEEGAKLRAALAERENTLLTLHCESSSVR